MQPNRDDTVAIIATPKRLIASSFIGSFIEWYDFLTYGIIAALVFGQLFFPNADPFIGTLASLGTFAVGFVARPVGGIFFGHFGDRIGRRSIMVATLIIMGAATVAIGLLPTYSSIGIWAPVLLTVLRFLQGFAVGGEWGGGALMLTESSDPRQRGKIGSWAQIGGYMGPLAGTVVVAVMTSVTTAEQFLVWGWRIPFLVSIVLIGLGIWVRSHLEETPAFEKAKQENQREKLPIAAVFRESKKNVLCVIAIHSAQTALLFVGLNYLPTYMRDQGGFSNSEVTAAGVVFLVGAGIACMTSGWASDRFGRRPVTMIGAVLGVLVAFPLFWAGSSHSMVAVSTVVFLAGLAIGSIYGPEPAYFTEMFPSKHRYTGISFGVQMSTVIAGATAPILATILLRVSDGSTWSISVFVIFWQLVAIVGVLVAGETRGKRFTVASSGSALPSEGEGSTRLNKPHKASVGATD